MDLTIVLTYENGELIKAVTRGNGIVGEVITNNARVFKNIPLKISFKGRLVLRGEAIITYSDFEKINETYRRCRCQIQKSQKSLQWFCPPAE